LAGIDGIEEEGPHATPPIVPLVKIDPAHTEEELARIARPLLQERHARDIARLQQFRLLASLPEGHAAYIERYFETGSVREGAIILKEDD